MNGFSREAFFAWWQKETVDRIGFVDQEHAAYHAWAAALEWYGHQQHLLDKLVGSNATDQSENSGVVVMKDISDLEFMINSLYKKWKYHVGHTYEWQEKNKAMFSDITARLEALEKQHPFLANSTTADQSDIQDL